MVSNVLYTILSVVPPQSPIWTANILVFCYSHVCRRTWSPYASNIWQLFATWKRTHAGGNLCRTFGSGFVFCFFFFSELLLGKHSKLNCHCNMSSNLVRRSRNMKNNWLTTCSVGRPVPTWLWTARLFTCLGKKNFNNKIIFNSWFLAAQSRLPVI